MNNCACSNISGILPFLKTISDKNRLKILCFLKDGEKCVCEIVDFMGLPQNLISHHLKKLKDEKILIAKKNGLKVIYSVNNAEVDQYLKYFNDLFK